MESKKINQLATELAPELSDLTIIGDPTTGISKKITLSQMASLFTGTVEEYANLASFPLVGTADTIYIALDTNIIYRWNTGTSAYVELSPNIVTSLVFNDANGFDGTISLVGSTATLTITTALTQGSIGFIGASGALTQDNSNFFWDNTNKRFGINTNAPTTAIDAFGSGIIGRLNGTSTNNAFLGFASAGSNKWSIGNVQSDHRFRIYSEANAAELVSVLQTGEVGIGIANPLTKLHIFGGASALIANLDANTSVAKSISFRSGNSSRINLEVSGTESGSNAGADLFIRRYSDAGALIDTPLTIVRSTGNIGIGITSPSEKLEVQNGTSGAKIKVSNTVGGFATLEISSSSTSIASINFSNSLSLNGGNVGINTTTANYQLTVNGNIASTNGGIYYLQRSSGSAILPIIRYWNGTGNPMTGGALGDILTIGTQGTNDLILATDNTRRLTILGSNGNIGIGTSAPNQILTLSQSNATSATSLEIINASNASTTTKTAQILFQLTDTGNTPKQAANIVAYPDGVNVLSAGLSFGVRAGDANPPVERMRLEATGDLKLGVGSGVTDTKFLMVSKGTTSATYSLVIKQSNVTTNLFYIRDDGAFYTGMASVSPYNNTTATAANVVVTSSDGNLARSTSSLRFKTNIEDLTIDTTNLISKMRPIWYRSLGNIDRKDWSWYGFIAEELAIIEPRLVHWGYDLSQYETIEIKDKEGNIKKETKLKEDAELIPDGVQYERITVILVAELQKMRKELDDLRALINK